MRLRFLALLLLLCPAVTARAFSRDPAKYPLRVHVFSRHVHHNRHFGAYYGNGRANLVEGGQVYGMEFTYDCSFKFLDSEKDEYYPAKWKKQGLSIEMLMGVIGSDDKTRTCEFKVALKDFVFARKNGHIVTMSPQEYALLQDAAEERNHALTPVDLDPNDYPLEFALLHLAWTGETNGLHTGTGQGNVRTPAGINAVDFSIHCPVVLQPTPEGRYLVGRWIGPGQQHMELLLRPIDVDGAPGATCDLITAVEPDVYIRNGANIKAISQADYKNRSTP